MMDFSHLIGIEWKEGRNDCYALIRRFYGDLFGVEMRDYASPTAWCSDPTVNLIMDNCRDEGFHPVPDHNMVDFRFGDLLILQTWTPQPSHCSIYVGDGKVLHHYVGRRSEVSPLRGEALNTLVAVLRHPGVKFEAPPPPTQDLRDFLSPMARARLEKRLAAQ